jgi:alanyl-tRNA synthetase
MKVEYERWQYSDEDSVKKLNKIIQTKKGKLDINDWIVAMQSFGIAPDKIAEVTGQAIPGNLYYEIALRQERTAKKAEVILYNTTHLPETENIYYDDHNCMEFDAQVIDVFKNVLAKDVPNIVILDKSAIYPTSGGQQHDNGTMVIEGVGTYEIVDAVKVGKVVLHILDRPFEGDTDALKGKKVHVTIDKERRR